MGEHMQGSIFKTPQKKLTYIHGEVYITPLSLHPLFVCLFLVMPPLNYTLNQVIPYTEQEKTEAGGYGGLNKKCLPLAHIFKN